MTPDEKIESLNLVLPDPIKLPPGVNINFSWVKVRGNRVFVSGHIALNADGSVYDVVGKVGSVYDVVGKVGSEVTIEQGYEAARQTGLSILSSLKRELGTLNNITAWLRVFGMINTAPGFVQTPPVINGFSDLILEIFGNEVGDHCRSAVGMAELPFGAPVEIEAELEILT
jgi:enamine deaminase RidA (YjgF/YER057c/UK114 family)